MMERILTNLQVEWLTNIKLLTDFNDPSLDDEDDIFEELSDEKDISRKLCSFIKTTYPEQDSTIISELEVLFEKKLINLKLSYDNSSYIPDIEQVSITKKGLDYLTMLQEELAEKMFSDSQIKNLLIQINQTVEKGNEKDILDKLEQASSIANNIAGLIPSFGNICQGLIPYVKSLIKSRMGL